MTAIPCEDSTTACPAAVPIVTTTSAASTFDSGGRHDIASLQFILDSFSVVMPDVASVQNGLAPSPGFFDLLRRAHRRRSMARLSCAGSTEGMTTLPTLSRLTVQVAMDNVDLVGIVVYSGYVSEVSCRLVSTSASARRCNRRGLARA